MAENNQQPNVLFLFTDQERYDISGPVEPYNVETPTMDRLAENGVRFDKAYTPVGICTSARASLLTGLYPHNHGMLNNSHESDSVQPNLPEELDTLGEILEDAGYKNTYIGKWHVGRDQSPEDFNFNYLGGGNDSHELDTEEYKEHLRNLECVDIDLEEFDFEEWRTDEVRSNINEEDHNLIAAKTTLPKEATPTYFRAEKTIKRIEEAAEEDKPFFHRTDFPGPHHPYVVPEPYASMFEPDKIDKWDSFDDNYENKPDVQEEFKFYRGVEDFDWNTWSDAVSKYFGFVKFIDDQMGRIMDALEENGLAEDTAVIHAADHGDMTGSHGQFNKGPMMYEDVYHIPWMMTVPGVTDQEDFDSEKVQDEYISLLDMMPTLVDMAGEEVPENVDGKSLVPLLEDPENAERRSSMFTEYHGDEYGLNSQRMVVKEIGRDEWKHVVNLGQNELYNLSNDPAETENLVDKEEVQEVRKDMLLEHVDWMERTEDTHGPWRMETLKRRARKIEEELGLNVVPEARED